MVTRMRSFRRKLIVIVLCAILIVVAFSFEAYAHSYVKIHNLKVVNSEEALTVPYSYNQSVTFSMDGAEWLILFYNPSYYTVPMYAYLDIFKIAENTSFFVQGINIVPINELSTSNPEGTNDDPHYYYASVYNNITEVAIPYIAFAGSYVVNFAVTFKVYETTLLGVFSVNQKTINFVSAMYIPAN